MYYILIFLCVFLRMIFFLFMYLICRVIIILFWIEQFETDTDDELSVSLNFFYVFPSLYRGRTIGRQTFRQWTLARTGTRPKDIMQNGHMVEQVNGC